MMGADAIRCMRRGNGGGVDPLSPDFVVIIDTEKGRSTLETRFRFNGPDVVIDWGDGVIEPFQSASTISCSHIYSQHGVYTIRVSGTINYTVYGGYLSAITECLSVGELTNDLRDYFNAASNLQTVPAVIPAGANNMANMFRSASLLNSDISQWDVSQVTDMTGMLQNTASFDYDLSNWCVQYITSAPSWFSTGSALSPERHPVWGSCP